MWIGFGATSFSIANAIQSKWARKASLTCQGRIELVRVLRLRPALDN